MKNIMHAPVNPVSPLAGYIGGKRNLANTLVPMINETPHSVYCEVFMGMGGVFFRRTQRPKVEAINDLSKDVSTLFRVVQRHNDAFFDMIRWGLASRSEFERLLKVDPDQLTDLERAARFLYLQRQSFGGHVAKRIFKISTLETGAFNPKRLIDVLDQMYDRLVGVHIDCRCWHTFIKNWDRAGTLFFLDPPYWGMENYYGKNMFGRDEFEQLSDLLSHISGKFILTLNDVPEVRRIFAWADLTPVTVKYSVGVKRTSARELIIRGK